MSPVVVTRPGPDGQRWVEALQAHAIAATLLPLIAIHPASDPAHRAELAQAQLRLSEAATAPQAVMFVSAAAVTHFFIAAIAHGDCSNSLFPFENGHCKAWATGQGTVQALLAAGVPATQIEAPEPDSVQWDSEALLQHLDTHTHTHAHTHTRLAGVREVLIVRGADAQGQMQGRDWLARELAARRIEVRQIVVYERHLPVWTPEQRAWALGAAQNGLWIFSASEAIHNLQKLLPEVQWSSAKALTTHGRIAAVAHAAGFGVVHESRPGLDQIAASIKSLR